MYNLQGKVALVTGAAHKTGMGHAIAVRLAQDGANMVVADQYFTPEMFYEIERTQEWQGLDSLAQEVESMGCLALPIIADITNRKDVDQMIDKALGKFGKIDILVNNAGHMGKRGVKVTDLDDEDWFKPIDVNLTGTFLCCRAVAREMIRQGTGGKIVNISSYNGKVGRAGRGPYCSSKFGVIGLTQALAEELAPYNVNVNAVCPGVIDTGTAHKHIALQAKQQGITFEEAKRQFHDPLLSRSCLKRMGRPEDVSNLVAFLVSSEADYITGQSINVDGGLLMAH